MGLREGTPQQRRWLWTILLSSIADDAVGYRPDRVEPPSAEAPAQAVPVVDQTPATSPSRYAQSGLGLQDVPFAKALVYLLTHSYSGRALAILRVVSNSGAGPPAWTESSGTRRRPSRRLSAPCVGTAINRNRSAGCTSPRATASARPRDTHHGRSSHAGPLLARSRSHRGNAGRRPFLRLSAGTPLCRCPG